MNRNVVSGIAAFALLVGAALAMNETSAYAGHCGGGLFAKLHAKKACGGGLFAKLKARHASDCCAPEPVCEPEPVCCEPAPVCPPEPVCCEPAPTCCAPEPACGGSSRPKLFGRLFAKMKARKSSCCAPEPACCEPAPAPCCEPAPAPCCGEVAAPMVGCESCGGSMVAPAPAAAGSSAGFDLAPGETLVPGSVQSVGSAAKANEPVESASDAAGEAASDAPPAPTPDADTNI